MSNSSLPPPRLATEARLRSLGLSSTSLEGLSPAARRAIAAVAEQAARELCAGRYLRGPSGVAINLLGDTTQLNAALAGPLREPLERSGLLDRIRLVPVSRALCAHTLATPDGYLDLADGGASSPQQAALLRSAVGGDLRSYAAVAVQLGELRVGTLCLYGTLDADAELRDAREGALRRYGASLSRQLAEAARLAAENDLMRAELEGSGPEGSGEGGIYGDRAEAAAWREVRAILGDVEHSVSAAGQHAAGVAACVVEVRGGSSRRVAILATSEAAAERFGIRPGVLRQVGDEDLAAFWSNALAGGIDEAGAPLTFQHDNLNVAPAAARLATPPGAFSAVAAAALPSPTGRGSARRGLVVLCVSAVRSAREDAARRVHVSRFARVVADAHQAAMAVYTALPEQSPAPAEILAPDAATLRRVRDAFGAMKLRALLALAEERAVSGVEEASSAEELLRLIALHATRLGRARRAHLESLAVRELLAIGVAGSMPAVEAAETKSEMIAAILEAEGLFGPAATAPLPALPVPPRHRPTLDAEQRVLAFDPTARWVTDAQQRSNESLPYSQPGAWQEPLLPRPPVPADETLRNAVIDRLGLGDVRDLTADDLVTFDGIAAGAAAVCGAIFGAVTLVHAEEQVLVGMTARQTLGSLLLGDLPSAPRVVTVCQYGVAKRAPLAVVDATAPEAGPIGAMIQWDSAHRPEGYEIPPRSYLGVPLVTTEGVVLGNVCILDDKPRPDFAEDRRLVEQLEGLAAAVVNLFELRRLRRENAALQARRQLDVAALQPLVHARQPGPPSDRVAMLMTDIEGSTELHERDAALMRRALEVHDSVLRRAIADSGGVEVTTEGDAFQVAFHTAADAIRCAFDAQLRLLAAPWPVGFDELGPSVASDRSRALAGCRVRMTVHFAEAGGGLLGRRRFEVTRHALTRRPHYRGPFVDEARHLADMANGGQVLVTQSAFDEVALTLTTALGDPRVVDLGRYEHALLGDLGHVYELMPRALVARSFASTIRVPGGTRLTSPGFIHAPRTSPLVVMFVVPAGLTELQLRSDAEYTRSFDDYTNAIRAGLSAHGGYEMKENEGTFMCAFPGAEASAALAFGADLHARIADGPLRCRVGINSGDVSIEPHARTGRLEAYGPPCNRAARLAKAANVGQTLVDAGTAERCGEGGIRVPLFDLGEHRFKGVDESLRVLQIGGGFHIPIRSLGSTQASLELNARPAGNITRSRLFLAAMDAEGGDTLALPSGATLRREQIRAVLDAGLAERAAALAAVRLHR